ncbi:hypothetical protein JXB12_11500 [candidate division KSB1 bacterium]|nr:hypothetical protein [candidate division KSB1 bacterium]
MEETIDEKPVASEAGKMSRHKQIDFIGRISFGVMIIWLGLTLFLMKIGLIYDGDWWSCLLVGLGIILLIESFIKMSDPKYKAPFTAKLLGGLVLVAIGSGGIYGLDRWWPLIIIAVGIGLVVTTYINRSQQEDNVK